jgi:DsbC/DsbD-like thiol-disulfide interchange protein
MTPLTFANAHRPSMFRAMKRAMVVAALFVASVASAHAAVGEWVDSEQASVRLIASGIDEHGHLTAGIEIELETGWDTYWRSPGDSGIAPVIDFTASQNVSATEVAFPVPQRHDDGLSVTNIYEGRIVLPVTATLTDPHAPTHLSLKLDIGVCSDVCVPAHFETALDVPPGAPDQRAASMLAQAVALLPKPAEPGVFAVDQVTRQGGTDKRPVFDLAAVVPDAKATDVFVEGPADWYADPPRLVSSDGNHATYRFKIDRLTAKTPIAGAKLRVTMVSGKRAVEQWIGLD